MENQDLKVDLELKLQRASEKMKAYELFDEAGTHRESYYQGYCDGFTKGRKLLIDSQAIWDKYIDELHKKHSLVV